MLVEVGIGGVQPALPVLHGLRPGLHGLVGDQLLELFDLELLVQHGSGEVVGPIDESLLVV